MIEEVTSVDMETLSVFDELIDVRSPGEFLEDHIPGAVNLPVLSNEERAEVGTVYKQDSKFRARRIGAAYVARNVAAHLETALKNKPTDYRPLIYCWRGGMRSNAMATILSQVGWRTGVLDGGYKTWRRQVVASLHDTDTPLNIVLIDGQTGTAKSEILNCLSARRAQTLDLEKYAVHRGSVFGAFQGRPQPTQKLFESDIWSQLQKFDPAKPIFVEAESNRIGQCKIPPVLWRAMLAAPCVTINAALPARSKYLIEAYADITSAPDTINNAIERLKPFHSKEVIGKWCEMASAGRLNNLAEALMAEHYDPLYQRSRKRRTDRQLGSVTLEKFNSERFDQAAARIISLTETNNCS